MMTLHLLPDWEHITPSWRIPILCATYGLAVWTLVIVLIWLVTR